MSCPPVSYVSRQQLVRAVSAYLSRGRTHVQSIEYPGNRQAEIREFPDPHAGSGEAVLKVRASGLCGTDLHRYRGPDAVKTITGHEPCGVIAELGAGAAPALAVGDRVICHHYAGCGVCEMCTMGNEQLCPHGKVTYGGVDAHGANADYILVPSRTLVHLTVRAMSSFARTVR